MSLPLYQEPKKKVETESLTTKLMQKRLPPLKGKILILDATNEEFPLKISPESDFDTSLLYNTIGSYPPNQQRLAISQLVYLTKPCGNILITTPLDTTTHDPLLHFVKLIETELEPKEWIFGHHAYAQNLFRWLPFLECQALIKMLEPICRFFAPERGISHVILTAHRKSILT